MTLAITVISDDYSVSPQIAIGDIVSLKAAGFDRVICNRPDDEEIGQPSFSDISAACENAGIACFHIPVTVMPIPEADVLAHRKIVENGNGKVLGYCRSGQRSAIIFAASA